MEADELFLNLSKEMNSSCGCLLMLMLRKSPDGHSRDDTMKESPP